MFVEERVYRLKPGSLRDYFDLYERKGLIAQRRHIPAMLGYYAGEIGELNEVVHLWAHASLDARQDARAAMRADLDFKAYWEEVRGLIVEQRTRILSPAPFFAERLAGFATMARGDAAHDPATRRQIFLGARSFTQWRDTPVSEAKLREIMEMVRWGPTSTNTQPLRIKFLQSPEAKARVLPSIYDGNVYKVRTAPVVAVLAYDLDFAADLDLLFPHSPDAYEMFRSDGDLTRETAFRNSSLQAGFFVIAARMAGLDVGPLSGFDMSKVDREFWAGTSIRTRVEIDQIESVGIPKRLIF